MKKRLLLIPAALLLAIGASIILQHQSYASKRSSIIQDRQSLFHGDVFHVLTYIKLKGGAELIPAMQRFLADPADQERVIYAGQAVFSPLKAREVTESTGGEVQWDAILLQQFDSRESFLAHRADTEQETGDIEQIYRIGMRRSATLNLLLPQFLLFKKIVRAVTLSPSPLPFESALSNKIPQTNVLEDSLMQQVRQRGQDAIVIVNLIQKGNEQQQTANAKYTDQMLGLMAENGYGPVHVGRAEAINGKTELGEVALVYYPGLNYFHSMATSTWFQDIIGNKQLAQSESTITVPITDLILSER